MESGRILIIEDDADEAEHLKLHLQQAGHRVIDVATTAEQAIACAEQENIDLMVVDIVLPGEMDGIEAVQKINEKHDIPAIFLTAYVSDELLLRAEQAHPFAYLLKPFRQREMEFMVNMSLTRARLEKSLAAEKQAAETELQRAFAIIQHTTEGIMLTDKDANILSVNPAFTHITGYPASEAVGQKASLLSSGEHGQSFYSDMWSSIHQSGYWQGEIWNRRKNHEVYPERLTINSIYTPAGELSHYVGIFSDITSVKQSEDENARLQRELNQAHRMEALGQLTGGIAHDFNNILGIIMGYIDMSLDQYGSTLPEKLVKNLETAMNASRRAKDLVAQMLTFSRSDNQGGQPLHLLPLIKDNIEMLRSILPSSIKVEVSCEENLPLVMMHPVKLQQMLMNLCINARDAMNGKGVLTIKLGWSCVLDRECTCCHKIIKGDWIELSVSDNGCGMSAETVDHIFEPFYTTKELGKGTGMGMSVLRGIISSHGGHALLETELNKGTTIRLLFPPITDEAAKDMEARSLSAELPGGKGKSLLVLDDEPMITDYLYNLLEPFGYQITIKTDSLEALDLFRQNPDKFSLLVTDQTMPGLTGVELIKQFREIRPDFPAILCTGYSEDISAEDAEKMNICYLNKPVNSKQFLQSITELLASA